MKKILLIGSKGFIGKKLKFELSKNFFLICPTKKQGFDITKKKELKKYLNNEVDIVINLSGQQSQNKRKMINIIRSGNINIINLAKKIKKKITLIYISTSLVYGNSKKNQKETSKKTPIYPYEKAKLEIEKKYLKTNKNYLILRFCNLYGGKDNKGIIKLILDSIKKKKLFYFDNIKTCKNFIFVKDVINVIDYLIKKDITNKVLNIGNENISFMSLTKMLKKVTKNGFRFYNKDINIKLTLSQKIDNKLIKNIMKKYNFQKLENYLKNEIRNK